jgi:hypothetical protein
MKKENNKLDKLKAFLKKKYPDGIQMFNTRNWVGDQMKTVYEKDGITVDECYYYSYIEIFGITQAEFESLYK